jgi:MFS family permease
MGGALFGALIILPLYYQVSRGESALTAGLLMAPQGVGAALAMPIAGRLTDRVGGGRVATVGLVAMVVATLPFALLDADTSYVLLGGILVLRGFGLGATMMPAMAAAYATLQPAAVPRATSALNVVQRIGGSLGTAILAVILQHEIRSGGQRPEAFAHTFTWVVVMTAIALLPALVLARATTRARRAPPTPPVPA